MNARADSPYDACLKEALVLSAEWVPRWLGALYDSLQQREAAATSLHDKQAFAEARCKLESHRQLLGERYLSMLRTAVLGGPAVETAASSSTGRRLDSLSFDDLELMDHDQVQETVEIARVQQVVKMSAEEEFVAFNARLNRAQGLEVVHRQAKNPLAPDAMVGVLIRALGTVHLSDTVRARWLGAGAVILGQELEKFYRRLTDQLDRWGVRPAGFQVVQKGVPVGKAAVDAARHDSVPAASLVGHDALLTLDHLHQLLTGNLGQGGEAVSDHGASGSGNAMVRTLASEVVTLMMRQITEDPRLLRPVRELLAGLRPVLLQLARSDPRFFADRQNPARRLLDDITTRGLAFTSEQDAGFAAYGQLVQAMVQDLQAAGQNLPARFPQWLLRLHQGDHLNQAPARGLAMQTLVKVEQRNLLAERVAAEIQARSDFARAPGVVRRFLTGPWSQVVAQARLLATEHEATPPADAPAHRYMELLPDLLWSSQLALASRNRPRLIKVIPPLLRTLREGLDSIDFPRAQAESFFQALMGLHEAAYKTHHNDVPADASPSRPPDTPPETWVQPAEARDSGFMDALGIETVPAFLDTEPLASDWHPLPDAGGPLPPLAMPVGTWVDLREGEEDRRCQLTWASPHGTLFLFNDATGRSLSISRRGLERLQELGRLRVVADHGLVEDALDGVARLALDNSGKS